MKKLSSKRENEKRLVVLSVEVNNYLRSESDKQNKSVGLILDTMMREKMKGGSSLADKVRNFIANVEGEL